MSPLVASDRSSLPGTLFIQAPDVQQMLVPCLLQIAPTYFVLQLSHIQECRSMDVTVEKCPEKKQKNAYRNLRNLKLRGLCSSKQSEQFQ